MRHNDLPLRATSGCEHSQQGSRLLDDLVGAQRKAGGITGDDALGGRGREYSKHFPRWLADAVE